MQTKLTIDKLLQNDDFIQWNVSGKDSSFQDWNKIIDEANSTDKKVYEASIKILDRLLSIDVEGHIEVKTEEFIDSSYIKLLEKFASEKKVTKVISINRILSYAAAILLPIAIVGLAYTYQETSDLFEDHLLAEQYNPNKIQIRTSDGKYYTIEENQQSNWITSNGLFISVTRDELKVLKADDFDTNIDDSYTVIIPRGQQYQVALEDGTKVELNSATQLTFNITDAETRKVKLDGEAFFDVAKDKTRPFIVHTKRMDIQVLGTEFNVSTYASPNYYSTTLVEGSIRVTTANGNNRLIEPSEQARISLDGYNINVSKVDVQKVVSWTAGRMIFRNEPLEVLTARLSRWFNIEFKIDENIKNIKFNGTITKEKNLLHILQMLKYTEGLNYEIGKDTIKLHKN
ncbi:MAG: DUF4974 domain-containing protein [Flavobacteriales bacterium]|nr:DUF4974 domain-containing protein [Flavobacteriales bacterium]